MQPKSQERHFSSMAALQVFSVLFLTLGKRILGISFSQSSSSTVSLYVRPTHLSWDFTYLFLGHCYLGCSRPCKSLHFSRQCSFCHWHGICQHGLGICGHHNLNQSGKRSWYPNRGCYLLWRGSIYLLPLSLDLSLSQRSRHDLCNCVLRVVDERQPDQDWKRPCCTCRGRGRAEKTHHQCEPRQFLLSNTLINKLTRCA